MPHAWTVIPFALLVACDGHAADARGSTEDLPVTSTAPVAPEQYRAATDISLRGGAPVEIALAIAGPFEGSTQRITQINEGAEETAASRVTLIRDGLLDDSVRGERWEIALDRSGTGTWRVREVRRAWLCWRGTSTDRFSASPCR